jgi:hypothetical protein
METLFRAFSGSVYVHTHYTFVFPHLLQLMVKLDLERILLQMRTH